MATPEEYAVQALRNALSMLSPTDNPWAVIRVYLRSQVSPSRSSAFIPLLYGGSALLSLVPILLIISLLIRLQRRAFWFARFHKAGGETYVIPHYSIGWAIMIICMYTAAQGFVWRSIQEAQSEVKWDLLLWKLMPWIPGPLSFWFVAWSLAASHSLHLKTTSVKTAGGSRTWPFYMSAWFLNTVGAVMPLLYIAQITVLSILANDAYKSGIRGYMALEVTLAGDQAAWTSGPPDPATLQARLVSATGFITQWRELEKWYSVTMYSHFGWGAAVVTSLVLVAVAHLLSLRKSMREMKERSSPSAMVIAQSMRSLLFIVVTFTVVAVILITEFLWVAILSSQVQRESLASQLSSILPTYSIALVGLPVSVQLLRSAIKTPKDDDPASASGKAALSSVQQVTAQGHSTIKLEYPTSLGTKGSKAHWEDDDDIELRPTRPRPAVGVRPGVLVTREEVSVVTVQLDDQTGFGNGKPESYGGW